MKGTICIIHLLIALCCSNSSQQFIPDNPLPIRLGDPYFLKASDNRYYMVGTGGVRNGFKMYSSSDLKSWDDEGQIYQGAFPVSGPRSYTNTMASFIYCIVLTGV